MSTTYIIETYAAAGDSVPAQRETRTSLAEARAEARRRLGVARLDTARRWSPSDCQVGDDETPVEGWAAYPPSHPRAEGCGGVIISRLDAE